MRALAMRRRGAVAIMLMLVVSSFTGASPAGAEPALPGECPAVKPVSQVAVGQKGNGWTVESGKQRERFRFEVLGIIPDGIGAGRPLIVVQVSDTAGNDMMARAGGIWAGMSGSPVYLDGKLLGAIAYGFTWGPSMIGGVTPAADMLEVLTSGSTTVSVAGAQKVGVPRTMRAELAELAGVSTSQVSTFERLPVPITVSGLNARARKRVQETLDRHGLSGFVVPSSSAARSAGATISERPKAGGNFAAVISYGNVTFAGVGTTTYVCGDRALAFGHPFTWIGRSAYGANNASALAVVKDPAFGSFKLANIGGLFGKLDQDRLAAVRASLSTTPARRTVKADVTNLDTGKVRSGRTDVTMNSWVPDVAAFHLLANADSVFDRIGSGSARVKWTINGKRKNGDPWQLVYSNRYASRGDITWESIFQMYEQLAIIERNNFEPVTFTGINIEASFQEAYKQYSIERVKISKNGGTYRERSFIRVKPGDVLGLRIWLRQYRGDLVRVDLSLKVPAKATSGGGTLFVRGSESDFDELPDGAPSAKSFPGLLKQLASTPKNNTLFAGLQLFGYESGNMTQASATRNLDRVVRGWYEIEVEVR
jgi:hypothetical protein